MARRRLAHLERSGSPVLAPVHSDARTISGVTENSARPWSVPGSFPPGEITVSIATAGRDWPHRYTSRCLHGQTSRFAMGAFVLLQPRQFELRPLDVSSSDSPAAGLFAVRFLFDGSRNWQTRFPTYVPSSAVDEFKAGNVVEVHLETLNDRGAAQRALPGAPQYAVLSMVLADGTGLDCVPPELFRARRRILLSAAALAVGGLALLAQAPVLAGLLFGLATHSLRTALAIPLKARFSTRATRLRPRR